MAMRGLGIYVAVGILVVLAMDFVAPPAGLGLYVSAGPLAAPQIVQHVDRSHKGDRLPAPTIVGRRPEPKQHRPLLVGCDPAYSPLSAAAHASVPARCVSEISVAPGNLG
jgi:hypothetical protein